MAVARSLIITHDDDGGLTISTAAKAGLRLSVVPTADGSLLLETYAYRRDRMAGVYATEGRNGGLVLRINEDVRADSDPMSRLYRV